MLPENVFVPSKPANRSDNAYATRSSTFGKITKALASSSIPIIYGGYGVGKTTLAINALGEDCISINIDNLTTISSFKDSLCRRLEFYSKSSKQLSRKSGSESAQSFEIGIADAKPSFKYGTSDKSSDEELVQEAMVLTSASENDEFIEYCESASVKLFVDEFHVANQQFKNDFSHFIKSYSNHQTKNFKICIAGTHHDVSDLVDYNFGIERVIVEVSILPLNDLEAVEILQSGYQKLGLNAAIDICKYAALRSGGSPNVVQYFGLRSSADAIANKQQIITRQAIDAALREYADDRMARHTRNIRAAIQTTGTKQYRNQILFAMAKSDEIFVTMEELTQTISQRLGEQIPSTAISGPLAELKNGFGQIIKDVNNRSGERILNTSTFSDPSMKFALRVYFQLEEMLSEATS